MRILYVINGFSHGGAELGLLTLLRNGFFSGHELTVLGLCRGTGGVGDAIRQIVDPAHFVVADPSTTLTLTSFVKGGLALRRELALNRPSVVILSLKQANIVGRIVLSFYPKIRCVSFEHIMRYRSRRFQWSYKYILWLLSYRVDEVWGDCLETIDATSVYFMGGRRRDSNVVPLFCVPDDQVRKASYSIEGPAKIAIAGRLAPVKNIDRVIDAVGRLRKLGRDVRLDVFGEGPERTALQRQIESLGLGSHVTLLGFKDAWQLEAIGYDIYINASDTEGFCIVVAEAMAAGLPVISTDVGGIREYGIDGSNMLKIARPDPDILASKIERLLDSEELRCRLGRQAAEDIRRDYSVAALRDASRRIFSG